MTRCVGWLAVVVLVAIGAPAFAQQTDTVTYPPTLADLQKRIDALEKQNKELLAYLTREAQKKPASGPSTRTQDVDLFKAAFEAGQLSPAAEGCKTAKGPKQRMFAVIVIDFKASAACLFDLR